MTRTIACVIAWSIGNESGVGSNLQAMYDWAKEHDPTRPVSYQDSTGSGSRIVPTELSDFDGDFYPPVDELVTRAQRDPRPYVFIEYAFSQGNSSGYLDELWAVIREHPGLMQGGFLWDWADKGLWWPMPGRPGEEFIAYGGDWGDDPNDESAHMSGLVLSDRTPTAKLAEAKLAHQPIRVTAPDLPTPTLTISNEHLFAGLEGYTLEWSLTEDGIPLEEGTVPGARLAVAPGESSEITLPFRIPDTRRPDAEYRLDVSLTLAEATPWAERGHLVAHAQFDVPLAVPHATRVAAEDLPPVQVVDEVGSIHVISDRFDAAISRDTGRLTSLRYDERELLASDLMPNFWRTPNDQELAIPDIRARRPEPSLPWRGVGEDWAIDEVDVQPMPGAARITVRGTVTTKVPFRPSNQVTTSPQSIVYTIYGNGQVDVLSTFAPVTGTPNPQVIGTTLGLRDGARHYSLVRPRTDGVDRRPTFLRVLRAVLRYRRGPGHPLQPSSGLGQQGGHTLGSGRGRRRHRCAVRRRRQHVLQRPAQQSGRTRRPPSLARGSDIPSHRGPRRCCAGGRARRQLGSHDAAR